MNVSLQAQVGRRSAAEASALQLPTGQHASGGRPPFRIIKRQSGYTKARYRGLFKNGQQLYPLLTLGSFDHVRDAWRVC